MVTDWWLIGYVLELLPADALLNGHENAELFDGPDPIPPRVL
jgi:hypothetical protein